MSQILVGAATNLNMSNVNFAHLSWKVPHINLFSFRQESTESANTTIEDEDLKGKVRCLLASLVSVCRSAVGYCCLSSVCQSHPLLLNNTYALPCLFPPPVLPVAEHSILPFPPYLVYLPSSGLSVSVFLVECAIWNVFFFVCPCSCCFFLSLVQCTARRFGNHSINSIWQPAGHPQNSEPKQAPISSVQRKSITGRRENNHVFPQHRSNASTPPVWMRAPSTIQIYPVKDILLFSSSKLYPSSMLSKF